MPYPYCWPLGVAGSSACRLSRHCCWKSAFRTLPETSSVDPRGQVVGGRDGPTCRGRVGRVLVGVVDGLERPGADERPACRPGTDRRPGRTRSRRTCSRARRCGSVSSVRRAGTSAEAERAVQPVGELLGQRPPADLLGDQAQQRVVGVAVLVVGVRREVRRPLERDVQHLLRCPDLRQIGVEGGRHLRCARVAVEPAAHLQQVGEGDVLAVWHVRNVVRDGVAELQLAVLGEQHDQRGRQGLGVRGDPEVRVAGRRRLRAEFGGADDRAIVPCGVRTRTIAPGTISSLATISTAA